MRESAYNYFKTLFQSSNEFIICIDDKQNIVYATDRVYPDFCPDDFSNLHLGSVLSARSCNKVMMAAIEPVHSVSFDFISPSENAPKRCVVIPTLFEKIYYYVLHISNTEVHGIDKLQRQDIETIIDLSAGEIANSTIPIVEIAEALPQDTREQLTRNIRKIRKVFGNLESVATNHTTLSECKVIDLCTYTKDLLERFEKRLGKKRFKFIFMPRTMSSMSKISLEALDVMMTNLINEIVLLSHGNNTLVYVMVCSDTANNFVIVSDTKNGLSLYASELIEQSDSEKAEIFNNRIIAARTVASKIARDSGGKAFFTTTFGGGVTNGIMLKKSKARISTLREESLNSAKRSDRLDILLSDI